MIDYMLVREENKDEIWKLEVGENVESDYHPAIVWMKEREREGKKCTGVRNEIEGME